MQIKMDKNFYWKEIARRMNRSNGKFYLEKQNAVCVNSNGTEKISSIQEYKKKNFTKGIIRLQYK